MTKLEDHMEGIINVFHQFSVRRGHFDKLSKGEMKQLITRELPNALKVGDVPRTRTHSLKAWAGVGLRALS